MLQATVLNNICFHNLLSQTTTVAVPVYATKININGEEHYPSSLHCGEILFFF